MNSTSPRFAPLLALLLTGACYHATLEPKATLPAPTVEGESMFWIDGLAPTDPVETAAACSDGVARVETHHAVLDAVANVLTLGLSTPMTITVTCGAVDRADLPTVRGSSDVAALVAEAAALAYATDTTVLLELPH